MKYNRGKEERGIGKERGQRGGKGRRTLRAEEGRGIQGAREGSREITGK